MYETNIWLDKADKITLTKQAQKKALSLSTYINIIVKHYYIISHENCFKDYIYKGKQQTHIKLRNENKLNLTPMIVTNAIYMYLHQEKITEKYKGLIKTEKLNRKIQSETDKTIDKFYLGNQLIRAKYYYERKLNNVNSHHN